MAIGSILFKDFFEKMKEKGSLKDFAFLFGNGLIKSYPKNDSNHANVLKSVALNTQEVWESSKEQIQRSFENNGKEIEAENFLNYIRRVYSFCAFDQWIKRQKPLKSLNLYKPREFFKEFRAIYTLNYDYLTYISILGEDKYSIKDGFKGSKPIALECIQERLKPNFYQNQNNERPFLYLHGAFPIFQQEDENYYKIAGNGSLLDNIQEKYDEIRGDNENLLNQQSKTHNNPIIVFSGKSRNKLAMIRSNTYLEYCLKELSKEKKIFTFGCSFEIDKHILDAIFEPLNEEKKEVYLGWYSKEDKENIKQYVNGKDTSSIKVTLVDLSSTQKDFIDRTVWGFLPLDHP